MSLEWEQTIVDARDPAALGRWWTNALGWFVINDAADEFEIRPTPDRLPGLLFVPVIEPKLTKNRLHLDLRPDDRDSEVARLLELGATLADVGQGDQSWIVLADPEGTSSAFSVRGATEGAPNGRSVLRVHALDVHAPIGASRAPSSSLRPTLPIEHRSPIPRVVVLHGRARRSGRAADRR
jgi:hypothetical protein